MVYERGHTKAGKPLSFAGHLASLPVGRRTPLLRLGAAGISFSLCVRSKWYVVVIRYGLDCHVYKSLLPITWLYGLEATLLVEDLTKNRNLPLLV